MIRIAINGLGRIGRAVLKQAIEHRELEVAAVNDLVPVENLTYLIKYDTVYGRYERDVRFEHDKLVIAGIDIPVLSEKDPAKLPWADMNVDLVFECSGVFTRAEDLKKHLSAGAGHVILSAPAKGNGVPAVVHGVNTVEKNAKIISCGSCTTNCIAPVMEILSRKLGVEKALMTTIHAYTSTQGIVDGPAKKMRRGRAGAANFVPTSTGAAKAAALVLPKLEGKFDGVAVRGPIPAGSIADIVILTSRETTVEEINSIFKTEAESSRYRGILGVTDEPLVSSDILRDPRASLVDLAMTQVTAGNLVKVMSWYDNEWAYAGQMIREAGQMLAD